MSKTEMKEMKGMECRMQGKKAYVVFADRERGITIHDLETDTPCLCLNRKELVEIFELKNSRGGLRAYHERFTYIINQILKGEEILCGTFSHEQNQDVYYKYDYEEDFFSLTMMQCAYNN